MSAAPRFPRDLGYAGLRMTADEYLALGETQERYELIDGVVVMSPSPTAYHGDFAVEILGQLRDFSKSHPKRVRYFTEIDVRLGGKLVYQPDISAFRWEKVGKRPTWLESPPDLVVEVLSPSSKVYDLITKREDYERFGVAEYWVVDPMDGSVKCWRRVGVRLLESNVQGDQLPCHSIPDFVLDLRPLRDLASDE